MKIELIHPPHYEVVDDRLDAPLGLMYIASSIRQAGFDVKINDLSGVPQGQLDVGYADIYGLTTYTTSLEVNRKIAELCKQRNPNCKVVLGGAHPTHAGYECLAGGNFDIVVRGEGELAMIDIIRDYPNNKEFYERPLDRNLDLYPDPARDLVDNDSYSRNLLGGKSQIILTSRGCPFRCAFCALAKHHKVVKRRSVGRVVEEIKRVIRDYNCRVFKFADDIFTMSKTRVEKLCEMLEPLGIQFRIDTRVGMDTREDYEMLYRAGCRMIVFGIESGSQRLLDAMNKQTTVEQGLQAIKWAKETGLIVRAFFMFGFPGEDKQTIEETKEFIRVAKPDQFFISTFVPYPSTDVWSNPQKYGVTHLDKDFSNYYLIGSEHGGCNLETERLSKEEFTKSELEFREWAKREVEWRGGMQDYEKIVYR